MTTRTNDIFLLLEEVIGEKISCQIQNFPENGHLFLNGCEKKYFLKLSSHQNQITSEVKSLETLQNVAKVKTPQIYFYNEKLLLMEAVSSVRPNAVFWKRLAIESAKIHSCKAQLFGFETDNFLGANHQRNKPCSSWSDFFWENRIGFLIGKLNKSYPVLNEYQEKLKSRLNDVLTSYSSPRLLHGDFWSGNFLCNENYQPVFIDPAVYYGDPQAEFSISRMFGGFDDQFYEEYQRLTDTKLLKSNDPRAIIYELYHWLNHLHLFGAGYFREVKKCLADLF